MATAVAAEIDGSVVNVLLFGGSGQVGVEIIRRGVAAWPGRDEADLSIPGSCARVIERVRPSAIINAAAYTAVDRAESEFELAWSINAAAPAEMARTASDLEIPFLHISTDYVFDGSGADSWGEDDVPAPLNAYGRTKLAGEEAVRAAGGIHAIVRSSWVISEYGDNFVRKILQVARGGAVLEVVEDQVGGPTPAADLAAAMLGIANSLIGGARGGLYHFSGAPDASWADLAREVVAGAGLATSIRRVKTTDRPTRARRPLNSRLDCSKLQRDFGISRPDWRVGLKKILSGIEQR